MRVETPASHANDPDTSYQAEQRMNISGKRKAQQQIVSDLVKTNNGKTSAELAQLSGLDRAMIARRLPELTTVKKGIAVKCSVNGTQAVTWWSL